MSRESLGTVSLWVMAIGCVAGLGYLGIAKEAELRELRQELAKEKSHNEFEARQWRDQEHKLQKRLYDLQWQPMPTAE